MTAPIDLQLAFAAACGLPMRGHATQLRPPPPALPRDVSVPPYRAPTPPSDAELEAAEQRLHATWTADRQTIAARRKVARNG